MRESLVSQRIESNLSRLRLGKISQILDQVTKAAEDKSKSYLTFLDELLKEEVAAKEQRRVETAIKTSGLPFIKSIDEFDFTFQPKLDRQKVMSLFDLTFIDKKANAIFLGPPGVGKTHLAVSLTLKACQAGHSIYFTTMEDLIVKLRKDHEAGNPGKRRSYYKSSIVIVDEVGYTPIDSDQCNLFFRFVANRYEKASTIITSNKAFSDWDELFSDQVIVTAILDRLLHSSVVINIKGNSYRLKSKEAKNVMNDDQKMKCCGLFLTTENGPLLNDR